MKKGKIMNCNNCKKMIEKNNAFCPFCGVKVEEEKKICNECGNSINEGDNFCCKCGCQAIKQEDKSLLHTTDEKTVQKKKTMKHAIIALSVIIAVVVIIVVIIQQNTLEKRLMRHTWWEKEITIDSLYNRTHWVNYAYYSSRVFCESGNIRIEDFEASRTSSEEIKSGEWYVTFSEVSSYNNDKWELLENDELYINDSCYKWDKNENYNTWYLDGDTLRIGKTIYTSKARNFAVDNKSSNNNIPYWCDYCGEEGPFGDSCPECDKTKKTKPEW